MTLLLRSSPFWRPWPPPSFSEVNFCEGGQKSPSIALVGSPATSFEATYFFPLSI